MECGINIHSQRIELVLHACNKSCFTSALSLNNDLMSIEYVFQKNLMLQLYEIGFLIMRYFFNDLEFHYR